MKPIRFILVMLVLAGTVGATPSTHIWAPSSDIQGYMLFHIHHDLYIPLHQGNSDNRVPSINDLGLSVGVLPLKRFNAEVGFDYRSGLGMADDYPIYFNAKFGIPEDAFSQGFPAIGIGIYDLGLKSDVTDDNLLYAKLAWTIPGVKNAFGRVSLGYFSGNDKLLLDDKGAKDNSGIMVAWERTMLELSDKLWICLDYQGTKSTYGSFNYGAAWRFSDNVAIILGYDIYNNPNLVSTLTWQLDIDIK